MKKVIIPVLALAYLFVTTAIASNLPSYYPVEGFQRTGQVDAIYFDEDRIVIGDISYQLSKSLVVHTLTSYSGSPARIRPGINVAFKTANGRIIEELWLLPHGYDPRERR